MWLPFVFLHGVVLWSLVMRGWRRMAIIPGIVVVFLMIWYYQRQQYLAPIVAEQLLATFHSYGLAAAWTVLVIGFRQLLDIFGLIQIQTPLRFLGVHLLGYLVGVVLRKKDVQTIFHRGRRVSGGLLFGYGISSTGRELFPDLLSGRVAITMAIYAFLVFVLGPIGFPAPRRITALLFVFLQFTILIYVIHRSDQFSVRTVLGGQIYLGILYGLIQAIRTKSTHDLVEDVGEDEILYAILRGERLQDHEIEDRLSVSMLTSLFHQIRDELKPLLVSLPQWVFMIIGGLNIVAMLIQLGLFIAEGSAIIGRELEIAFRMSVAVYIVNYVVLKHQHISARGQRLLVFLLINFGIYLTIYHLVGSVPVYLVGCGVVRSLLNAVVMIQMRQGGNRLGFSDQDYRYRLVGNMVAVVINIYFIFLLPVSIQLRFTLATMYLALQFLLLKYQIEGLRIAEGRPMHISSKE